MKIHYTSFPVTSPLTGKLPACYGLVADLLRETGVVDFKLNSATRQPIPCMFGSRVGFLGTAD